MSGLLNGNSTLGSLIVLQNQISVVFMHIG